MLSKIKRYIYPIFEKYETIKKNYDHNAEIFINVTGRCISYLFGFEISNYTLEFSEFLELLHPNIKISPICLEKLKSFGDYRLAILIFCKKIKSFHYTILSHEEINLTDFEIDPANIDRIYDVSCLKHEYLNCKMHSNKYQVKLSMRIRYPNKPLYIDAYFHVTDIFHGKNALNDDVGYAFICKDINIFFNVCTLRKYISNTNDVNDFLFADEKIVYDIEKKNIDLQEKIKSTDTLSLKNLCLKSVSQYQKKIKNEFESLPSTLAFEVHQFNKLENFRSMKREYLQNYEYFTNACSLPWILFRFSILKKEMKVVPTIFQISFMYSIFSFFIRQSSYLGYFCHIYFRWVVEDIFHTYHDYKMKFILSIIEFMKICTCLVCAEALDKSEYCSVFVTLISISYVFFRGRCTSQ